MKKKSNFKTLKMKSILNLGKKLSSEEQKNVKGGIGVQDPVLDVEQCKKHCEFDPIDVAQCKKDCEDLGSGGSLF